MSNHEFKARYPSKVITLEGEDITEEALPLHKIKLNITILLDEMCTHLKEILEGFGWGVITVKEVMDTLPNNKSVDDEQIFRYALRENVFLVTRDRELKNKCALNKIPCISLSSTLLEARIVNQHLKYMQDKKMRELKKTNKLYLMLKFF